MTHRVSSKRVAFETRLTYSALGLTAIATTLYFVTAFPALFEDLRSGAILSLARLILFLGVVSFLIYGNVLYQFTRLGYWKRLLRHGSTVSRDMGASRCESTASPLTVLIPSYKEDPDVVRKTLLSAALQQYPNKRIVLLIDDPPTPTSEEDAQILEAARALPAETAAWLKIPAERAQIALRAYETRMGAGTVVLSDEWSRLQELRQELASWFWAEADRFTVIDHTDAFFVDRILRATSEVYREEENAPGSIDELLRRLEYLAAVLTVDVTSFERKHYANLSHDPSKAANLNSYLSLIGRRHRARRQGDMLLLEHPDDASGSAEVDDAAFVITLDADSLILPDYARRLVHFLEQPENCRVGVVQTPYSAFPGAPGILERIAGATTDIQYFIHQGFTRYRATFWVGANAVLRKSALDDISMVEYERGFPMMKFIQDRTVIEDTESTLDLIARGWSLVNFPERLAYSATPPDFGSLLIQRGRWANGGLIMLPKLLRYLWAGPGKLSRISEGLVRFHYLSSIAGVSTGLVMLLFFPFGKQELNWWLPFTALPYFMLYGRDLVLAGYRATDLFRVYAFNLLLIPAQLAGVSKSLRQALTGQKTPFKRTPKVPGRTASPAWSVLSLYGAALASAYGGLWSATAGNLPQAAFSWVNGGVMLYASLRFIGWRATREDVALAWTSRPLPALRRTRRRLTVSCRYRWQRARRRADRWYFLGGWLLGFGAIEASLLRARAATVMILSTVAFVALRVQRLVR